MQMMFCSSCTLCSFGLFCCFVQVCHCAVLSKSNTVQSVLIVHVKETEVV